MRWLFVPFCSLLFGFAILSGQEEEKKSALEEKPGRELKVGDILPKPFDAYTFKIKNRDKTDEKAPLDRQHCLVCHFNLNPSVMIFAKEPAEGKDGPLQDLLKKVDAAVEKYFDLNMGGAVVYLSPHAVSTAHDPRTFDMAKLISEATQNLGETVPKQLKEEAEKLKKDPPTDEEIKKAVDLKIQETTRLVIAGTSKTLSEQATHWSALVGRIKPQSEKLKGVLVSCFPLEGPPGYYLNPNADITVIFYHRLKVISYQTFEEGKMQEEDNDQLIQKMDHHLSQKKKR